MCAASRNATTEKRLVFRVTFGPGNDELAGNSPVNPIAYLQISHTTHSSDSPEWDWYVP